MGEALKKIEEDKQTSLQIPLLSSLLGLVTPESMESLVSSSTAGQRIPLTVIIEEMIQEAKVIPFPEKDKEKQEFLCWGDTCEFIPEGEDGSGKKGEVSTTVFIISEKKKLELADRKLKKGNIVKLYKKASKIVISKQTKDSDNDMDDIDDNGLLIDKKHF